MTTTQTKATLEADLWNSRYPIGTPVEVTRDNGEKSLTCTRSFAWDIRGRAVILLEGIRGGYDLGCVLAIEEGQTEKMEFFDAVHSDLMMRPEDKIHWLHLSCKHLNSLLQKQESPERRIVMTVRAKFYVSKLELYLPPSTGGEVVLFPVYSEDPNHENKKFWDATPSGTIQMCINNPAAIEQFAEGMQFYVDFTPAPKG